MKCLQIFLNFVISNLQLPPTSKKCFHDVLCKACSQCSHVVLNSHSTVLKSVMSSL